MKHFPTLADFFNETSLFIKIKKCLNKYFIKSITNTKEIFQYLPSTAGEVVLSYVLSDI